MHVVRHSKVGLGIVYLISAELPSPPCGHLTPCRVCLHYDEMKASGRIRNTVSINACTMAYIVAKFCTVFEIRALPPKYDAKRCTDELHNVCSYQDGHLYGQGRKLREPDCTELEN